jgi:hypothetical protein
MVQPLLWRRIQSGPLSFLGKRPGKTGQEQFANRRKDWSLPKTPSRRTAEAAERPGETFSADENPDTRAAKARVKIEWAVRKRTARLHFHRTSSASPSYFARMRSHLSEAPSRFAESNTQARGKQVVSSQKSPRHSCILSCFSIV